MHKRFLAISVLALSLVSGAAYAAEAISGKVESFDQETRELVLDTGEVFVLDPSVDTDALDEGDEVTLSYDTVDEQLVVTEMEIAE